MANPSASTVPAAGAAQPLVDSNKQTVGRDVTKAQGVSESVPESKEESSPQGPGIVLEGLGNLNDVPQASGDDDPNEGSGEYVTVLSDIVSGNQGQTFVKGHVRRISKLVVGYGVDKDLARANAKRLFDGGAIRLATGEEKGQDMVQLDDESIAVRRERLLRAQAENELAKSKLAGTPVTPSDIEKNPAGTLAENWQ